MRVRNGQGRHAPTSSSDSPSVTMMTARPVSAIAVRSPIVAKPGAAGIWELPVADVADGAIHVRCSRRRFLAVPGGTGREPQLMYRVREEEWSNDGSANDGKPADVELQSRTARDRAKADGSPQRPPPVDAIRHSEHAHRSLAVSRWFRPSASSPQPARASPAAFRRGQRFSARWLGSTEATLANSRR